MFCSIWVYFGLFCYCIKLGAKQAELEQLMQKFVWWGHQYQRYIHSYTSPTWSYYSRSCSPTQSSSKFILNLLFTRFRQWRVVHSFLLRNNGVDQKGRGNSRVGFGLWDSSDLWGPPRLHTDFVLDVQVHHGKLIKSTFKWIQPHLHICSESAAIVKILPSPNLILVLRHLILAQWAVYQVESIKDAS